MIKTSEQLRVAVQRPCCCHQPARREQAHPRAQAQSRTGSLIQDTPNYQLSLSISRTRLGLHLRLTSFMPNARRPENRTRFEALFSNQELWKLHDLIRQAQVTDLTA